MPPKEIFGGEKNDERILYLKAWAKNWLPKIMGDFGIREFIKSNEAFLSRIIWWVLSSPNLLVSQILKWKYFSKKKGTQATKPSSNFFWFWKGCQKGITTIMQNAICDIGDGKTLMSGLNVGHP